MEHTLGKFIQALRQAEVRISPAETLDALSAVEQVGYHDRNLLKNTLGLVLAKSAQEKEMFEQCFERFFSFKHLQESANESANENVNENPVNITQAQSQLGQLLLADDRNELAIAITAAGNAVNLQQINLFTQKGLFTQRIMERLGLDELQAEIRLLGQSEQVLAQQLQRDLQNRRDWLREQVRDYVEQQFLLHADVNGKKLREELLRQVKLANVEPHYFRDLQAIVQRMAKQLIATHSRRKKRDRRGQLHMARTLRHNMAYDGKIFNLHWKAIKIDRPKVFAICDVSGSVSNYARFMLTFLYSLEEVLPKVRSFAFSSTLGEVTQLFQQQSLEQAVAETMHNYGNGSTDYGQAWLDFKKLGLGNIDQRSTIIVLGDSRNNYGPHRAELLQEMYNRCKRLIWLNPEPRNFWRIGDAEMQRYSAYCHRVEHCNSLRHLERVVGKLLQSA